MTCDFPFIARINAKVLFILPRFGIASNGARDEIGILPSVDPSTRRRGLSQTCVKREGNARRDIIPAFCLNRRETPERQPRNLWSSILGQKRPGVFRFPVSRPAGEASNHRCFFSPFLSPFISPAMPRGLRIPNARGAYIISSRSIWNVTCKTARECLGIPSETDGDARKGAETSPENGMHAHHHFYPVMR